MLHPLTEPGFMVSRDNEGKGFFIPDLTLQVCQWCTSLAQTPETSDSKKINVCIAAHFSSSYPYCSVCLFFFLFCFFPTSMMQFLDDLNVFPPPTGWETFSRSDSRPHGVWDQNDIERLFFQSSPVHWVGLQRSHWQARPDQTTAACHL